MLNCGNNTISVIFFNLSLAFPEWLLSPCPAQTNIDHLCAAGLEGATNTAESPMGRKAV